MGDDKRGLASADEQTRQRVASQGGQAVSQDPQHMSDIGKKGGKAAQASGHAHKLTQEERSKGGSMSGGNFANDPERAREAGRKGGSR